MTPTQQMELICTKGHYWQTLHGEIVQDALIDFMKTATLKDMEILNYTGYKDGMNYYGLFLTAQIIAILGGRKWDI